MKTTKTLNDQPAEGHAILERHISSFTRTRNGAWIGAGGSTERFEIPLSVLNSCEGAGWFNPGRTGNVTVKLPDGSLLNVDGGNDPIRTYGFGELGYVDTGADKLLVHRPHPLLPNIAPGYYRVAYFTDGIAATFTVYTD